MLSYKEKEKSCTVVPYPFFPTPKSFISLISTLFTKKEQAGFMPIQTSTTIEPQLDTIASEPIDCPRLTEYQHDNCSSFSTSSTSTCSSGSEFDLNYYEENTNALSDLLCDHYVQSKATPHDNDVPLETFRIFQGPSVEHNGWIIEQETEWKLVEASEKYSLKEDKEEKQDITCNRAIRTNSNYFRIIVAEVNMMRAQKIVGPLRQRRLLDKRLDCFVPSTSSPLKNILLL